MRRWTTPTNSWQRSARKITLRPGRSITLHVHFVAPIGTSNLIASMTPNTQPADNNGDNDIAFTTTA